MLNHFKAFRHPHQVRIPLYTKSRKQLTIQKGSLVFMGQPLTKASVDRPYSTVSGEVKDIVLSRLIGEDECYHAVIENDRKDTAFDGLKHYHAKDFIKRFFMPSAPFEALDLAHDKKLIVFLNFMNEPFVSLHTRYLVMHQKKIYTTLKRLIKLYALEAITFVHDKDFDPAFLKLESLKNCTFMFKTVNTTKAINYQYKIINKLTHYTLYKEDKQQSYNALTIESLLMISEMLEFKRPPCIKTIVMSGDALVQPSILEARLGTPLAFLVEFLGGYQSKAVNLAVNHLVSQKVLAHDTFSLTRDMNSLHFTEHYELEMVDCIECGRCNTVCPVGILPSKIYHLMVIEESPKRLFSELCIECGLCTYVCPSNIPVHAFVKEAAMWLKEELL